MNFTPAETQRFAIFSAAELARCYRTKGIRLNHTEAAALICDEVLSAARRGMQHAEVVAYARSLLSTDDVAPGVAMMMPVLHIEVSFAQGTRLVSLEDPIGGPRQTVHEAGARAGAPGATAARDLRPASPADMPADRGRASVDVLNTSDRAIQVRSHAHFFDANRALKFDREATFGMRIDRPSGAGVRFEPGEITHIHLVRIAISEKILTQRRTLPHSEPSMPAEVRQRGLRLVKERGHQGA